jgi:ArsR family transcriptional regulator, arsenate/arsenite/antimonite-responsive transcriptional repressor / arsenate reductase (thioredoxin)
MDGEDLQRRAAMHAALGEPVRLAIVEQLATSDRSPKELGALLDVPSNLLAHHLDVLEAVGLIARGSSAGDRRRKYVRLLTRPFGELRVVGAAPTGPVLFLCSHNSARSQLAAALWTARTGETASSAGTHPAPRVHRGAVAAARRAGLSLHDAIPRLVGDIPAGTQVVTVCDRAHEELHPTDGWWHWSIPDPVESDDPRAFDAVVDELEQRINAVRTS